MLLFHELFRQLFGTVTILTSIHAFPVNVSRFLKSQTYLKAHFTIDAMGKYASVFLWNSPAVLFNKSPANRN